MAGEPDATTAGGASDPGPSLRRWPLLQNRRLWLGFILSVGCLALALIDIDFAEMAAALRSANMAWTAAAAASVLVTSLGKAWRWRLLLSRAADDAAENGRARSETGPSDFQISHSCAGRTTINENGQARSETGPSDFQDSDFQDSDFQVSLPRLTNIWLAGAGVNLALPVPRGGDVLRVYWAGEAGGLSKSTVLGTVAAEKLLDIVMVAICFLALLVLVAVPDELAQRQTSTLGVAALLILLVTLLLWQRERLLALASRVLQRLPFGSKMVASLERGLHGLAGLRQPGRLLGLATLTVAIWFLSVLTNYLVFLALDMPPSWVQSLFVLVVLQIGVAVPSTPGKIGLFQVLCRWALGVFGVSAALGLAYGVLLYLVAPLLLMVLGALALIVEGWRIGRLPAELDTVFSHAP